MVTIKIVLFILLVLYLILLSKYLTGWKKTEEFPIVSDIIIGDEIYISILIALRNEEKNIPRLFQCLEQQTYPKNLFEIILVDDHSVDRTWDLIRKHKNDYRLTIKALQNLPHQIGKKTALLKGIQKAKGEVIIQSDADCRMGENWISTLAGYYIKNKPSLVIAPVQLSGNSSFLSWFQIFENAALMVSTCGSIYFRKPILANGANMLYEKNRVLSYQDPFNSSVQSGDDIFLTLKINEDKPSGVHFLKSKSATVTTDTNVSFQGFWQQRKRWIQKSNRYKNPHIILSSLIILLGNLLPLAGLIYSLITREWWVAIALFGVKMTMDTLHILSGISFLEKKFNVLFLAFSHALYPVYVFFLSVLGTLGTIEWKERKFK